MARTVDKVHIGFFTSTLLLAEFISNDIHRDFIYRETDTLIWFSVITLSIISKWYAAFCCAHFQKLLVTLLEEMSNIFTVKWFNLVKSESLPPSVAKVYGLVFILDTRSTWKLCVTSNALFSMQKVIFLAHWYCIAICESGNIFLNKGSYLLATVQQSTNCFEQ